MTAFTTRYGDPAHDGHGAHMWAYERHGCTVIAVTGRIDGANVAEIIDYAAHFATGGMPIVLDLGGVSVATPNCVRLLRAVADRAEAHARVVLALGLRITSDREAQRTPVLVEEVFLFEAKPGVWIV